MEGEQGNRGGGSLGELGKQEVYGRREKRRSNILKVVESGRNMENYTTLHGISQKSLKKWEPTKLWWEPVLKGTGRWSFNPPCLLYCNEGLKQMFHETYCLVFTS